MAGTGIHSVIDERVCIHRRVVRGTEQAGVESTQLDIWTGLDGALHHDRK